MKSKLLAVFKRMAVVSCIAPLLALGSTASAATRTWQGSYGNWNLSANWNGGLPGSADSALIKKGGYAVLNSNVGTISSLVMGTATSSDSAVLSIQSGGVLNITGTATLTNALNSTADINQDGGSMVIGGNLMMGRYTSNREATYTLNGGSLSVVGSLLLGNQGNGYLYQKGGTVSVQNFYIGYTNPGTGGNTAIVQIRGGNLISTAALVIGNAGANSGTTSATLEVVGSQSTVTAGTALTMNSNTKSTPALSFLFDTTGISKVSLSSGAATLGGILGLAPSGGVALTGTNSFRLLDFPSATTVTGWFSPVPATSLWSTPSAMTIDSTRKVLDVALSTGGKKGALSYSGLTTVSCSFTATSLGYVTVTGARSGEDVYTYLSVDTGTTPVQDLISYFIDNGIDASTSDLADYTIRLRWQTSATTSYLIWDLSDFSSTAAVSKAAVVGVREPGAQGFIRNGSFERGLGLWNWQTVGSVSVSCAVDSTQSHWEGKSAALTYSSTTQSGSYGKLSQTISGLVSGTTYYAYVWCKGTSAGTGNQIASGSSLQFTAALPSGTFDWQYVELQFTADSTTMELAVLLKSQTTTLWVDDIYVSTDRLRNVTDFGIVGNGTTDVTTSLSAAVTSVKFLYFPAGTYLTSAQITLPTNVVLWGAGSGSIISNSVSTNILYALGTDAAYTGNVEVSGIHFVGADGNRAIYMQKAANLLVRNSYADTCGLVRMNSHKSSYAAITSESDLSKNIRVVYNTITNPAQTIVTSYAGVALYYSCDVEVYKNTISYMHHGIMWWGGNANYDTNGANANPRWARRMHIWSNSVSTVGAGGVWGAMGKEVKIEYNTIATCGDVALDLEGCFDCLAQYNTVSDGYNGSLTTFFASSNIVFQYNTVTNTQATYTKLYGDFGGLTTEQHRVTLRGNRFSMAPGTGIGIVRANTPGTCLTMTNNILENARISCVGVYVVGPVITDNVVSLTYDVADEVCGIDLKYRPGNVSIARNIVDYAGATTASKIGIRVLRIKDGSDGTASTATINDNAITGCGGYDIYFYYTYTDTVLTLTNNILEFADITVGAQNSLVATGSGNITLSGVDVPLTWIP